MTTEAAAPASLTDLTRHYRPPAQNDRTPPHNLAAEQAVIGGMLLSKEAIGDATEILRDNSSFYDRRHAQIYDAILHLYNSGVPADALNVADRLEARRELAGVGGADYLHTCMSAVLTAANTGWYARIVEERALFRRIVEAGTKIVQIGHGQPGTAEDGAKALDLAQKTVYDITSRRDDGEGAQALGALLQMALVEAEAAGQVSGMRGVPTGFRDLDRLLSGLQAGQLLILAGRPGFGKSTAGIDFARYASIHAKTPVAVFSLEMSKLEIVNRILSAEARVPLTSLRSGQLTDDDWARLARKMGDIEDADLYIDDTPSMTLMEIRAKARRLKQQHGIKMIVVDYLQLMSGSGKADNRQQEVSELSRGLKLLAKEVECAVVAVSQLNRGPEQRTDKRPVLSDLRESGSIEQDADIVILLHRDDYYDKESPRAGEADFIVAKHRNGPTDTITVAAQLHLSRFVDLALT